MSYEQPYGAYNQPSAYSGGYTPQSGTNINQAPYQPNQASPQNDKYQTYGQPTNYVYETKK